MTGHFELVALGNPLLDMQVRDGEQVLKKYNLNANDAILAGEEHMPIYKDIAQQYPVAYVAGGASQNAARCAQYVLPEDSTAYFGCVGDDDLAEQLRAANQKEGLRSVYQVKQGVPTGSCAVIITGHHRSLCTNLGAAEKFDKSHLETAEAKSLIQGAKYFYMEGFFLTHGAESAMVLAEAAVNRGVPFAINLSAPFIPQFFTAQLNKFLEYSQIVLGNEAEAEAYAEASQLGTKDLTKIAQAIADGPNKTGKARTVIISHGAEDTILAISGQSSPRTFPTPPIATEDIVDTNGAGDAFAGGVLGALIAGKKIEEAIAVGQRLGGMCVGQSGPVLKFPKEKIF